MGVLRDLLRPPPGGQRTGSLCLQPGLRARRRNVSAAVVPKRSQAHRSAPLCQECVAGGALADDFGLVEEVGGHGAGYTAKLLVNLLWFGQAVATAEALLLGQRAGIDLRVLEQVLAGSSAASTFICRDLGAVFHGDYLTSFGLDRICEELETVNALARDHQVPFELSDVVYQTYRRALARYGPVDGELLAAARLDMATTHRCQRSRCLQA